MCPSHKLALGYINCLHLHWVRAFTVHWASDITCKKTCSASTCPLDPLLPSSVPCVLKHLVTPIYTSVSFKKNNSDMLFAIALAQTIVFFLPNFLLHAKIWKTLLLHWPVCYCAWTQPMAYLWTDPILHIILLLLFQPCVHPVSIFDMQVRSICKTNRDSV